MATNARISIGKWASTENDSAFKTHNHQCNKLGFDIEPSQFCHIRERDALLKLTTYSFDIDQGSKMAETPEKHASKMVPW